MGVDLLLALGELFLGLCDGVGAGDEPQRRLLELGDRHDRLREFDRVAGLFAVHAVPERVLGGVALGVVPDRHRRIVRRLLCEQLGAEEARIDNRDMDPERLDLRGQGLHPAIDCELRRGVGGPVLKAGEARRGGDRHDVPGALLAHDRQHGAGDGHRTDQGRGDLPVHLLGRELLEEAGVEARRVVDQHVDAAEALDGRLDGGLCVLAAGDVELGDDQVVCVAERLGDGGGVAAGGHDVVAGGQRGLGDVDAQAAAGAGDDPGFLFSRHESREAPNRAF